MDVHSKAFSTGANRPMHVSNRDSPQSLEFWKDGRQSGNYANMASMKTYRRCYAVESAVLSRCASDGCSDLI